MASLATRAATGGGTTIRISRDPVFKLLKSSFLATPILHLSSVISRREQTIFPCLCMLSRSRAKSAPAVPCLRMCPKLRVKSSSVVPYWRVFPTLRVKSSSTAPCLRVFPRTASASTSATTGTKKTEETLNPSFVSCWQQAFGTAAIRCGRIRSTSRAVSTSASMMMDVETLNSFVSRRQQRNATAIIQCRCLHSASTSSPTTTTTVVKKGEKQSPKLLMEVFAELELPAIQEMVGGVRVRQHVNPLKASLVAPHAPVKWETVFADCTLPLTVDIGCGPGRLLMVLGKRSAGTKNFLGLDVRWRLVDRANLWADELNLTSNVHFLTSNATVAFGSLLATYPGPLAYVYILCPDPHFKRRHQKRRIVQKQLVDAIVHHLKPGGKIFVQSDVKEVAVDMRAEFEEHLGSSLEVSGADCSDGDVLVKCDSEGWVEENPLGVPSEREAHVIATGGRVYRALYRRI